MWNISAVQPAESLQFCSKFQVSSPFERKKGKHSLIFKSVGVILFCLHTVIMTLEMEANPGHPHWARL